MALTDWGRRCALVIQSGQVTDNEVNFPLLVTEDTLPSEILDADGSYPALNGGGDIRFSSDEAGNTQLACEIESFITDNDPANGKAAIWVKVPSLSSSSNTTIYIWYNKAGESQPAEDNAYGKENVWDSNFVMVQHMNQTPDGTAGEIVDSTSNDNDGTTYNMDSADQVAGQIDGSLDFDGGDDYVDTSLNTAFNDFSVVVWFKDTPGGDGYERLVDKAYNTGFWLGRNSLTANSWGGGIKETGSPYGRFITLTDGEWHQIAFIREGTTHTIYGDGGNVSISGSVTGDTLDTTTIKIGGAISNNNFGGTIDEVRISNTARSAGWIATEYNNQYAPSTFLIEGTPETPGAAPSIFIPQIIMF